MSKDIWYTGKEKATEDKLVFAQHKSLIRDKGVDWFIWEPQEFTDAIREDVIAWTYLDDLLALETELERTRKALDVAVDALKLMYQGSGDPQDIMRYKDNRWTSVRRLCKQALEQINNKED